MGVTACGWQKSIKNVWQLENWKSIRNIETHRCALTHDSTCTRIRIAAKMILMCSRKSKPQLGFSIIMFLYVKCPRRLASDLNYYNETSCHIRVHGKEDLFHQPWSHVWLSFVCSHAIKFSRSEMQNIVSTGFENVTSHSRILIVSLKCQKWSKRCDGKSIRAALDREWTKPRTSDAYIDTEIGGR